ncbi:MAG: peptidase family protein [Ilumatobacteraceae bacterium]|nr:peptidase family protein [Ilumatobacteraceae bacterium]
MAIMPMFPLGSVLLPGAVLPLHVFEPRYRQLVQDCLTKGDHEFGVVLIERGLEVGGGDQRCSIGTVARLIQVAELTDGRYALVTVGTRRVRVVEWLPDDPYPLADVDDWPDIVDDDDDTLAERISVAWARVRRMNALAVELGDAHGDVTAEPSDDPLVASYHLSALAPLGPADQQRLLAASGPAERIDLLDVALDDAQALQQFRLQHPSGGVDFGDDFGDS